MNYKRYFYFFLCNTKREKYNATDIYIYFRRSKNEYLKNINKKTVYRLVKYFINKKYIYICDKQGKTLFYKKIKR